MLRFSLLAIFALLCPTFAQAAPSSSSGSDSGCQLRINASPSTWMIRGHDVFANTVPEASFGVTFSNSGTAECKFTPLFKIISPPFGLSSGSGRPVGYTLISLLDSRDVTPRPGNQPRPPLAGVISVGPGQSKAATYRLSVDSDDVRDAGTFSQQVTLEAEDSQFRTLAGTGLSLGIEVLPSARLGLAGAYTVNDGRAFVDLGELRSGPAAVPLQLRVSSTGRYDLQISSLNSGRLRLAASEWTVPYALSLGGAAVNLSGIDILSKNNGEGFSREALPFQFVIGDVDGRAAGIYSDTISISVTAR